MKLHDFSLNGLRSGTIDFSEYKGKKVVLVNVASECGLTPQYEALQELYEAFSDKNVMVIGVPCNDFGAQEPGSADEIAQFCSVNYGVTFPLTEKIHTKGAEQHPLYTWLTTTTGTEVEWNFQKYLLDEEGNVVRSVAPSVLPTDPEIVNWLQDGSTNS